MSTAVLYFPKIHFEWLKNLNNLQFPNSYALKWSEIFYKIPACPKKDFNTIPYKSPKKFKYRIYSRRYLPNINWIFPRPNVSSNVWGLGSMGTTVRAYHIIIAAFLWIFYWWNNYKSGWRVSRYLVRVGINILLLCRMQHNLLGYPCMSTEGQLNFFELQTIRLSKLVPNWFLIDS